MTTEAERATQRQSTADLFAAFADSLLAPGSITSADYLIHEQAGARLALWRLTNIADPMTLEVLEEIHAERRRRMSAATREGRRAR